MKAALILLALLCAGCTDSQVKELARYEDDSRRESNSSPREVKIYQDSETGCEYAMAGISGLTPRMGADGKQICREVKK